MSRDVPFWRKRTCRLAAWMGKSSPAIGASRDCGRLWPECDEGYTSMFMGQNNDDGARLPAADEGKLPLPSILAPGPARHLFSTQGLPATSRLELWEQHNAQALLPLDIRTIDESPLLAQEINLRHGELRFAGVTGSSQVVERNEAFIKKNPTDAIAIFFTLEQEAFFFHRGGNEFL